MFRYPHLLTSAICWSIPCYLQGGEQVDVRPVVSYLMKEQNLRPASDLSSLINGYTGYTTCQAAEKKVFLEEAVIQEIDRLNHRIGVHLLEIKQYSPNPHTPIR